MTQQSNHASSRARESGKAAGSDGRGKHPVGLGCDPRVVALRLRYLVEDRHRLVAIAVGHGLDRSTAEDVVHDTLIKVAQSETELTDDELSAYATTAVRRTALNVHRDTANRVRIAKHAALRPEHEHFENRVLTQVIASELLFSLTETESSTTVKMLVMWAVGQTHAEIAELYGMTESAVQSRLHRVLKKQRDSMAK